MTDSHAEDGRAEWPPRVRLDPLAGMRFLFEQVHAHKITVDDAMNCLHLEPVKSALKDNL